MTPPPMTPRRARPRPTGRAAALAERIFTEADFRPFLTSTSEVVGGETGL